MSRARVVFNQVLSNSVDETQFGLVIGLQNAAETRGRGAAQGRR